MEREEADGGQKYIVSSNKFLAEHLESHRLQRNNLTESLLRICEEDTLGRESLVRFLCVLVLMRVCRRLKKLTTSQVSVFSARICTQLLSRCYNLSMQKGHRGLTPLLNSRTLLKCMCIMPTHVWRLYACLQLWLRASR
jgi:hypothetical protein